MVRFRVIVFNPNLIIVFILQVNEADLAASECRYICNEDSKTDLYQYIHRYTTIHLGLQDMTKSGKVSGSVAAYTV